MQGGDIHGMPMQPNEIPLEVKVEKGLICIGARKFRVKIGDDFTSSEELLSRAKSLVSRFFTESSLRETLGVPISLADDTRAPKFRIIFTADSATVERSIAGETVSQLDFKPHTEAAYEAKLQTIKDIHRETKAFQTELLSRLSKFPLVVQKHAAQKVLQSGHIALGDLKEGDLPERILERTLNDVLQESGNEALRASLQAIADMNISGEEKMVMKTTVRRCTREIKLFVLNNLSRTPQVVQAEGATYVQRFEKPVQTVGTTFRHQDLFQPDKSWSSEADRNKVKKGECQFEEHVNNLGAIYVEASDGTSKCLVTRSGRSENPKRLRECVVAACIDQLKSSNPTGFTYNPEDSSYSFEHVITSYLDHSVLKPHEPTLLDGILESMDSWPKEGYTLTVNDTKIVLKRPIFANQPFSPVVKGVTVGRKAVAISEAAFDFSRKIGFVSSQQLLKRLMDKEHISPSYELLAASERLRTRIPGSTLLPNGMIDFDKVSQRDLSIFSTDEYKAYQQAVSNFIRQQEGDAWKALYVVSFMQLPSDGPLELKPAAEHEMHVADIEIYRNLLIKALNLSNGKQCMSGCDRTGIGLALACAQDMFRRNKGYDFIPPDTIQDMNREDLLLFKTYFRESLRVHAKEVTILTKGVDGLRIFGAGGNPVLNKYLFLEEDTPHAADVTGVTYEDLFARGKRQYKGKSVDPLIYGGQGQRSIEKKVERTQKYLAKQKERVEQANTILEEILGIKGVLNKNLELAVSVKKVTKPLHELKRLSDQTKNPEVRYALLLIINIMHRRELAHQIRKSTPLATSTSIQRGLAAITSPVILEE